jgi:hypothetical protein
VIVRSTAVLLLGSLLAAPAAPGQSSRFTLSQPGPAAYAGERTDTTTMADSSRVSTGRVLLVGGILATSMVTIHLYQQQGWWRDNRAPFHFDEDLVYGLGVDKLGHFYGGYVLSYGVTQCLRWAGVRDEPALWWGSAGSLLFQTYVEVEDGFSSWGFDRVDFAGDLAGAAWPLARHYVPELRAVDLKLSYAPSPLLGEQGGSGFRGQQHLVIDDYEGQNFWLSLKVEQLLPAEAARYWPDFLCLAVGYGARDVAGTGPHRVWFLGLDYDMTRVIPRSTGFLRSLGEVLNFIRLPAPAVRIAPGTVWYGLYFAG